MNTARPTLAKGVKLRHDRDGSVILLVPEGALVLNRTAAVALELVNGKRGISTEMAVRLEQVFGGSAESWLVQQAQHDLARVRTDRIKLKRLEFA